MMVTCSSGTIHWPNDRVSHLADTRYSGRFTPNEVIGHLPIWPILGCPRVIGAVDDTVTLQPLAGSLQIKFIFICAFHHIAYAI